MKNTKTINKKMHNILMQTQRQLAYQRMADKYFIAYQAYTELGEDAKAMEMKELWLKKRK
jgi:hypothetical protein